MSARSSRKEKKAPPQAVPPQAAPPQAQAPSDGSLAAARVAVSRRRLLGLGGAAGVGGLAVGAVGGVLGDRAGDGDTVPAAAASDQQLAFYGEHQPGMVAPLQSQAWLVAFDLKPGTTRAQVAELMRTWSAIAANAMAAKPLTPGDDAMAAGRGPSSLTVTVGFGSSLLAKTGLAGSVPDALAPIPVFLNDQLDPAAGDGDLGVFVAGNDGLVVVHALRALQRAAAATTTQRWQLSGFADAPGSLPTLTSTPRNLMGQIDGTDNPKPGSAGFDQQIYVAADARPAWMRGGSYLVVRRIRMLLDDWDTLDRSAQEAVIGRTKDTGAPLSGGTESTPPDYDKQNPDGSLMIPAEAHIRQASPSSNQGAVILRRPFNFYDGTLADGSPNAGLMFLAFQADPRTGFVPIQQRLAGADTLSTFIRHEASALFAVPPGCRPGGYLGQDLLEGA